MLTPWGGTYAACRRFGDLMVLTELEGRWWVDGREFPDVRMNVTALCFDPP